MKILHIIPTYKPAYSAGGPTWSVHALNKKLVKKGVDVTVYTTNKFIEDKVPINRVVNVDGVKVFYFPTSHPRKWEYSKKLRKSLKESIEEFDLIHITSVFLSASTCGAYYAIKNDIPYIISPRGALMKGAVENRNTFIKKLYLNLTEKRSLKNASGIHFTTQDEKEEYKELGLPLSNPIVIPNGLEEEEFDYNIKEGKFREKYNISKDKKIILFLSRVNWKKGLDALIPSFNKVLKEYKDAVLVVAGGDDKDNYLSKVKEMVRKHNLEDKVIFTGMILDEEKVSAYQDADVFALPSYSENFGIVVAEAMYFGLPIVTTPNVGISNIVEDYNTGFVVEKDVKRVSSAILKIIKNRELSEEMSKNGKRATEKEFSMGSVAEKWIESYNKIINYE